MKILKIALLGRSLPYSISPEVHREIFGVLQHKWAAFDAIEYTKIELADEGAFFACVREGIGHGFAGFNVTFPYKYAAATMGGQVSELVQEIHSANTITCGDPLRIISTDGAGFQFALEKSFPTLAYSSFSLAILGAGGAARAVLHALRHMGWKKITLAARSIEAARRAAVAYDDIQFVSLADFMRDSGPHFIVQATPVGQRGGETLLGHFEWQPDDIAADLVYNPLRTRFLDRAAHGGAKTLDGLGMLIEQAALSQYFWITGTESQASVLTNEEFQKLHASLSKHLKPRWDASDM
jgi:shikimate dehydrogenase